MHEKQLDRPRRKGEKMNKDILDLAITHVRAIRHYEGEVYPSSVIEACEAAKQTYASSISITKLYIEVCEQMGLDFDPVD
jgi:hypothetical protein